MSHLLSQVFSIGVENRVDTDQMVSSWIWWFEKKKITPGSAGQGLRMYVSSDGSVETP